MEEETIVFIALAVLSAPVFVCALWFWRVRRRAQLERQENKRRNRVWRDWQNLQK